jgi:hypothetical protein
MHVLEENPQGIRWIDLLLAVEATRPDRPHNSVHGGVHNLLTIRASAKGRAALSARKIRRPWSG